MVRVDLVASTQGLEPETLKVSCNLMALHGCNSAGTDALRLMNDGFTGISHASRGLPILI